MMKFRGMLPPDPAVPRQTFASLFHSDLLPPTPASFGQQALVDDWGMLGNDQAGDCMFAGMAHAVMYLRAQIGESVTFSDAGVLADYGAVTGYVPGNPSSDIGTSVDEGMAYWQRTGIADSTGVRHRIDGFATVAPGDVTTLLRAAFLLGGAGIGFALPDSAEKQFDDAEPWDVIPGDTAGDGHYVPLIALNSKGNLLIVTWRRIQAVTPAFVRKYMIFGAAPLSLEWIRNSVSPRGVNEEALAAYLAGLPK